MSQDNFYDVGEFHSKFGLPHINKNGPGQVDLSQEVIQFRTDFLQEEFDEFKKGVEEQDVTQMADALVDLVYIALGTAHLMGLPWYELWDDVQRANISKQRAKADGSDSKRGSSFDVIKPEGWVGPRTAEILRENGFDV